MERSSSSLVVRKLMQQDIYHLILTYTLKTTET